MELPGDEEIVVLHLADATFVHDLNLRSDGHTFKILRELGRQPYGDVSYTIMQGRVG